MSFYGCNYPLRMTSERPVFFFFCCLKEEKKTTSSSDLHLSSAKLLVLVVVRRLIKRHASWTLRSHSPQPAGPSFEPLLSIQADVNCRPLFLSAQGRATPRLLPSNATLKILNTRTLELPRREAGGDPQIRKVAQKYCFLHVGKTNMKVMSGARRRCSPWSWKQRGLACDSRGTVRRGGKGLLFWDRLTLFFSQGAPRQSWRICRCFESVMTNFSLNLKLSEFTSRTKTDLLFCCCSGDSAEE